MRKLFAYVAEDIGGRTSQGMVVLVPDFKVFLFVLVFVVMRNLIGSLDLVHLVFLCKLAALNQQPKKCGHFLFQDLLELIIAHLLFKAEWEYASEQLTGSQRY